MGWSQGNDREEGHENATGSGLMGASSYNVVACAGKPGRTVSMLGTDFLAAARRGGVCHEGAEPRSPSQVWRDGRKGLYPASLNRFRGNFLAGV